MTPREEAVQNARRLFVNFAKQTELLNELIAWANEKKRRNAEIKKQLMYKLPELKKPAPGVEKI